MRATKKRKEKKKKSKETEMKQRNLNKMNVVLNTPKIEHELNSWEMSHTQSLSDMNKNTETYNCVRYRHEKWKQKWKKIQINQSENIQTWKKENEQHHQQRRLKRHAVRIIYIRISEINWFTPHTVWMKTEVKMWLCLDGQAQAQHQQQHQIWDNKKK